MLTKEKALGYLDKVIEVLEKQGRYANVPGEKNSCAYRVGFAPDGLRCGVGALILDEHYNPGFEGVNVMILDEHYNPGFEGVNVISVIGRLKKGSLLKDALIKSGVDTDEATVSFLRTIQEAHDYAVGDGLRFEDFLANLRDKRKWLSEQEEATPTA